MSVIAARQIHPVSDAPSEDEGDSAQLEQLRLLLLGSDYQALVALQQELLDPERYSQHVAAVISEALQLRGQHDESLSAVLSPTVEQALSQSVEKDPQRLASALYPVMGPAIRKSINEVLTQTLQTFNQLLEQSLSPRALSWRFDAWRTGRSYPEVVLMKTLVYQVEQVFLIHRESGLLLQHVVSTHAITKDPDMVSGMLTAIQDFIHDSFAVDGSDTLQNLRLGDLTVLLDQGPYAVIAAVVRGNPPATLVQKLADTNEVIHRSLSSALQQYEGDNEPFTRIQPLLESCLALQLQERKRKPWLALLVIVALVAGLGGWFYQRYLDYNVALRGLEALKAEAGIVVLDLEKTADGYRYHVLRDPQAREPTSLLPSLVEGPRLHIEAKSFLSMEPALILARAKQMLVPPDTVSIELQGAELQVSGQATPSWQQRLDMVWPFIPGVQSLQAEALQVEDKLTAELTAKLKLLTQQIEAQRFSFAKGSSELAQVEAHADTLLLTILELVSTARQLGRLVQVSISGATDETGTEETNSRLARERAYAMHAYLLAKGVPASVLAVARPDSGSRNERIVRYSVELY